MITIGSKYVDYIKRVMGRQTYSNRYYEYAYTYGAIRTYSINGKPKLLDVGSGFSSFTKVLNSISDCCASDNDVRTIERQRGLGLKCKLCDATSLPFAANTFDIITSVSAIEHFGLYNDGKNVDVISADTLAVGEIKRVLKPTGLFIFTVPFANKFYIERRRLPATPQRWYDSKHIKALISEFGVIVNITYGRYIYQPSNYKYCTLNENPSHIMVTVGKSGENEQSTPKRF